MRTSPLQTRLALLSRGRAPKAESFVGHTESKTMTRLEAVLLAFLACAVSASAGPGQTREEPPKAETARFGNPTATARALQGYVYGVVKKIGTKELLLDKTEFGDSQVFLLEPKTRFIHDGKPSKRADLKVGDMVFVDAKKNKKTGEMIAKKVVTGVNPTSLP